MQSTQKHFSPEPAVARSVRTFARETLDQWEAQAIEWAVVQAITELATNVILHARTPFIVQFQLQNDVVTACVTDSSPAPIVRRPATGRATTGRGLTLVSMVCAEWGVDVEEERKTIWCKFPLADGGKEFEALLERGAESSSAAHEAGGPAAAPGFNSMARSA